MSAAAAAPAASNTSFNVSWGPLATVIRLGDGTELCLVGIGAAGLSVDVSTTDNGRPRVIVTSSPESEESDSDEMDEDVDEEEEVSRFDEARLVAPVPREHLAAFAPAACPCCLDRPVDVVVSGCGHAASCLDCLYSTPLDGDDRLRCSVCRHQFVADHDGLVRLDSRELTAACLGCQAVGRPPAALCVAPGCTSRALRCADCPPSPLHCCGCGSSRLARVFLG